MKKVKTIVDILLTIIFILLMANQITGIFVHEILGISVIVLFVVHQLLNINHYKKILKGNYNKLRVAYLIIDISLFVLMIVMMISALFISRYTLSFLNISNDLLGRELHILSSYLIYILIGLHMGLHYNLIFKFEHKLALNLFMIIFGTLFGIQGFIKREFINKLTLKYLYPIYSNDSFFAILIDYIGILVLFVIVGYGVYNLLRIKKEENE